MISSRRGLHTGSTFVKERHDLFNQLIHAHDDDDVLTEDELIGMLIFETKRYFYYPELIILVGNVFLFLFAGHETTAHTLAFALGLLAIYPDEQQKLVQQILQSSDENLVRAPLTIDSLYG
jgi:cytochrome P450